MRFTVHSLESTICERAMTPLNATDLAMLIRSTGLKLNTTFGVIIQIVNNVFILQELIIRTNDFDCSIKRRDKRNKSSKMTFNILSSADQKSNNFLRIAITCNKRIATARKSLDVVA
jgi:hypothetical protein